MNNLLESVLIGVWIRTQSYYYSVVVVGFLLVCKEEKAFILIRHDKTKSREYILDKPLKESGGEEVNNINTAAPRICDTSSKHEKREKTTTNMVENVKVPNIVQMEKETNQETIKHLLWDDFMGNDLGLPY